MGKDGTHPCVFHCIRAAAQRTRLVEDPAGSVGWILGELDCQWEGQVTYKMELWVEKCPDSEWHGREWRSSADNDWHNSSS
jgi:hypothetical protein